MGENPLSQPYFASENGLRFECTGCGDCCRKPGPVFFPGEELHQAATALGLTPSEFKRRYRVRRVDGVTAIDPGEVACPFLSNEGRCNIYDARPTQCRTFPFWPEVALRKRSWDKAARDCEGMNQGPRHSPKTIAKHLATCSDVGLPYDEPW